MSWKHIIANYSTTSPHVNRGLTLNISIFAFSYHLRGGESVRAAHHYQLQILLLFSRFGVFRLN